MIFLAESANYGESVGNNIVAKKISETGDRIIFPGGHPV